ncbi:hypothetical protein KKF05_01390 [Patescibacteria group bacterium]|nr:hypothetical protein [Patescibacteria group bacterium]MBU1028964.1 hypothetical protein [Patescibacteria group bacterium]MBU1916394.1 hypothetical protein [Patescibacteria group bacterium]
MEHQLGFFSRRELVGQPGATPDFSDFKCQHQRQPGSFTRVVLNQIIKVRLPASVPLCRDCFIAYLIRYATSCTVCNGHILPGDPVAEIPIANQLCLAHRTKHCARYVDRYCGIWGQGRLISLHELMPDIIPAGVRTMAGLNILANGGQQPFFGDFGR